MILWHSKGNEDNGYCGKSDGHQDAQEATTYDFCAGAATVGSAVCSVDTLLAENKCPPVDMISGRCGPLKNCFACGTEEDPYCNEASGWCVGAPH